MDVKPVAHGNYRASASLPTGHPFYSAHTSEANRLIDPMLLLECCRQAETYLAHTFFGVEADAAFALRSWSMLIDWDAIALVPTTSLHTLVMATDGLAPVRWGDRTTGLGPSFRLMVGSRIIGRVELKVSYVPRKTYDVVRSRGRDGRPPTSDRLPRQSCAEVVPPASVGRLSRADTLLSDMTQREDTMSACLRVPVDHRSLFDHPQDHVPGTVLVEAARQLATYVSTQPHAVALTSMEATFRSYTELDAAIRLEASSTEPNKATVSLRQRDTEVAWIRLESVVPKLSTEEVARCVLPF
ncbi:ScbA/BarX family gamma-butyrolactone biosynthesis protein [Streptomyces phaeofaciens JCM 4814]|uniref:Adhesin n=1 Tax=Streptomyces phaeofaciens TaxID=68254 RepID=A0A918HPZ7_9ACTN|nr:adhesin [Streptomyces phaeofaciens]